ncbi:activator of Hsp90 ATPase 1 family protein [Heterostelium album PN500]|uniref:Activator of Hsp90 ATPase 1 family protein n=1 Tax=Heterostelium pallidum (strain ATCC 26659 / Pp 5 / PN500) TaxID=670386 RepID=D3BH74_HETP5|nr:activator of Hsp90 ATPase 1 family protein [Heterostelium album PN500]EFA79458.1 activator of Hsp90 ATPase 1 family protein [Heterostelium album PN500]|eukprot:XP_020431579.1 activator of Hsp90 ATPase 1 family protein [Heterostelium album PN500]
MISQTININHRIGIKSDISNVYEALSTIKGLSGWWTEEVSGDSNVGGKINFFFRSLTGELQGQMVMEVTKSIANQAVHWRCLEGPQEWIGTDFQFNLTQQGEHTIVLFANLNWREYVEFTSHCSMKWATFLLSLRSLVEEGKGRPAPNDIKIDNWN